MLERTVITHKNSQNVQRGLCGCFGGDLYKIRVGGRRRHIAVECIARALRVYWVGRIAKFAASFAFCILLLIVGIFNIIINEVMSVIKYSKTGLNIV